MPELVRQKIDAKRMLFYILTIIFLVFIFYRFSEIELLWSLFNRHNLIYLVGVILLQLVVTNYFLALNYRDILLAKNIRPSVRELFPITFIIQFISQALPSAGISGQVFFIYYLRKYRVGTAEGISRAILEVCTLYVSYAFFFIASVAILLKRGVFTSEPRVAYFIYGFIAFAALITLLIILSQKRGRSRTLAWFERMFQRHITKDNNHLGNTLEQIKATLSWPEIRANWQILFRACLWQGALLMGNVLTLYLIGHAIDAPFSFAVAFIAYTFAKLISMTSFFPGAPLVFEGAIAWLLITLGVPKDPGIAAGIIYAAFSFWLPMPIGWVWYAKYMKKFEAMNDNALVS